MLQTLKNWYEQHFSDPRMVMLLLTLFVIFAVILLMGDMLAPVLASIVIAYLLEGLVGKSVSLGIGRTLSVIVVFSLFMLCVIFTLVVLMPQIFNQSRELIEAFPSMLSQAQQALLTLPMKYPDIFTAQQIHELTSNVTSSLQEEITGFGKSVVTWSLSSVVGAITLLVYLILVPLLVFFFMKDKDRIMGWMNQYLPGDRSLASLVWEDVNRQIGNYVRGKFIEIIIIWVVCLLVFAWFGLNFAMLLALLVGLSVIIPYIGAAVVTIPVVLVAYFQWGFTSDFYWVLGSYLVIQALDGNALVPLLFSEVVNLHPIAIIVAILVFGGLWGFWGVFFAIPLATLVQAILKAWPQIPESPELDSE